MLSKKPDKQSNKKNVTPIVSKLNLELVKQHQDSDDEDEFSQEVETINENMTVEDGIVFINNQDDEIVLDEYLSVQKLKSATGAENLEDVNYLEIIVDTTENTFGNLGEKMPGLTQLKLNNSTIPSIRDLGTSLLNLQVLWLARCHLEELEGIAAFPNLKELYLAFNNIEDISPLAVVDSLQILDLEGNAISDMTQMNFLSECKLLNSLTLDGNPISSEPNYRRDVATTIPNLKYLDDRPVDRERKKSVRRLQAAIEAAQTPTEERPGSANQERDMIVQSIKFSRLEAVDNSELTKHPVIVAMTPRLSPLEMLEKTRETYRRPSTASSFSAGFHKPLTARPATSLRYTPRPASARERTRSVTPAMEQEHAGSELTYGSKEIICGNPVKSLRRRMQEQTSTSPAPPTPSAKILETNLLERVLVAKLERFQVSGTILADIDSDEDDVD